MKRSRVQSQNHDWLWPLHSVGNTGPIFSGLNMTPRFSMCSISTNILTVLANFLAIQNSIFSKNIGHDRGNTRCRLWIYRRSILLVHHHIHAWHGPKRLCDRISCMLCSFSSFDCIKHCTILLVPTIHIGFGFRSWCTNFGGLVVNGLPIIWATACGDSGWNHIWSCG